MKKGRIILSKSVRRDYSPDRKQGERVYKSPPKKILLLLAT